MAERLGGGVFAVHPLRVESVAWVTERKDVLSGLFFMLTLFAYVGYVRAGPFSSGRYRQPCWHCFRSSGLAAKPMAVTLPFLLLLLDYWPLGRMGRKRGEWERGRGGDFTANRNSRISPSPTLLLSPSCSAIIWEKVPMLAIACLFCL